ncbi:hypothetical protein EB796_002140 [Bugula neritina]|uniref:Uncharacterized protein n=1 Tax=Bugula neritina TaxID=10212 RepID=A0A7J7KN16_BUGNE|nr:hypothetical protein EB796_002140 [Bugula neritina]
MVRKPNFYDASNACVPPTVTQLQLWLKINTNDSFTSNYKVFMQDHYDKICGIAKTSSTETRVYVFLGDHDPMVQFVRCLAKHANISEYAIIHIREFADKFEYTSDTALRRLTNTWIESVQNTTSNALDYSFRQLITLMHRKSQHDSAYLEFESRVRDHMTQPPFNIIALPGQFNDSIDAHGDAEGAYSAVAIVKESNSNYGWALKQVGTFRNLEDSNEQLV